MKQTLLCFLICLICGKGFCWGFFGHQRINYYAVFLLPPDMIAFYKPNIQFLTNHSVDPDKRRYVTAAEGPKHYIDIDRYGAYPFLNLPRRYDSAIKKFGEDTLIERGIVPWWIEVMQARLTKAFRDKDPAAILKLSAEIGHYVADAHVPLHANSNHDGQYSDQKGIHAFWESRIPELLAEREFDFVIGKAIYIENIEHYTWNRVLESAAEADTVLEKEAALSKQFSPAGKFAFEERNGKIVKQYSANYSEAYNKTLQGMVERRMRTAIATVASFWYTAWVNAGQPDLKHLQKPTFSEADLATFLALETAWRSKASTGRVHE